MLARVLLRKCFPAAIQATCVYFGKKCGSLSPTRANVTELQLMTTSTPYDASFASMERKDVAVNRRRNRR
jgi:hypothetical protein